MTSSKAWFASIALVALACGCDSSTGATSSGTSSGAASTTGTSSGASSGSGGATTGATTTGGAATTTGGSSGASSGSGGGTTGGATTGGATSGSGTTSGGGLPNAPEIVIFPDSQAFGSDIGFGTFVGTSPQQSFSITNRGQQTLVISSVSKSGDSAFSFVGPNVADPTADGGVVDSRQQTFVTVTFTPTMAESYTGKLTIKSNAATGVLIATDGGSITPADPASIDIPLSGLGILAPDGG